MVDEAQIRREAKKTAMIKTILREKIRSREQAGLDATEERERLQKLIEQEQGESREREPSKEGDDNNADGNEAKAGTTADKAEAAKDDGQLKESSKQVHFS